MAVYPPHDYIALRSIPNDLAAGYRAGDGMYAQVVDNLKLVLGVDVAAARPGLLDRPADSASRAAWVDYALTQDPTLMRADTDDLTRADLIARCPDPSAKTEPPPPKKIQPKA